MFGSSETKLYFTSGGKVSHVMIPTHRLEDLHVLGVNDVPQEFETLFVEFKEGAFQGCFFCIRTDDDISHMLNRRTNSATAIEMLAGDASRMSLPV